MRVFHFETNDRTLESGEIVQQHTFIIRDSCPVSGLSGESHFVKVWHNDAIKLDAIKQDGGLEIPAATYNSLKAKSLKQAEQYATWKAAQPAV